MAFYPSTMTSGVAWIAIYRLLCHLNLWWRIDSWDVRCKHPVYRSFSIGFNDMKIDISQFTPLHWYLFQRTARFPPLFQSPANPEAFVMTASFSKLRRCGWPALAPPGSINQGGTQILHLLQNNWKYIREMRDRLIHRVSFLLIFWFLFFQNKNDWFFVLFFSIRIY